MQEGLKKTLIIGIDSGVNTGIGIVHEKFGLQEVTSMKILDAFDLILEKKDQIKGVVVEDARFVKYKVKRERAQGAGSVKRDAILWEDFLIKHNIPYKMVRPNKQITKWESKKFAEYTGWTKQTNNHGRDAALLALSFRNYFN